ncbi:unnamed protein product, partial [Amoebophrya sp. A25]|eukprot:GSA25T00025264001.1
MNPQHQQQEDGEFDVVPAIASQALKTHPISNPGPGGLGGGRNGNFNPTAGGG